MARPYNHKLNKPSKIGLSPTQMKGAVATAVLGTLATAFTTNLLGGMQARRQARIEAAIAAQTEAEEKKKTPRRVK